jgi:hypothetical protein
LVQAVHAGCLAVLPWLRHATSVSRAFTTARDTV